MVDSIDISDGGHGWDPCETPPQIALCISLHATCRKNIIKGNVNISGFLNEGDDPLIDRSQQCLPHRDEGHFRWPQTKKEWRHVAMLLQTKLLMDRLQARIGAGTRSDTIRRALALLELVTADQDKGGEVSIRG